MRAVASDRRPRKVADERSRRSRSAVASYGPGVCLGLAACIITILLFELTGLNRDTIPEPELRLAYAQAPPSVPPAEVRKLPLAAGEYTSTGIERSTNQQTSQEGATNPEQYVPAQNAPVTHKPEPALTKGELETALKRASELIAIGDIAGARLVLERGANANDAATLFALAQTYDPVELAKWRVIGPKPDPDRAKHLYERASLRGRNPAFPQIAGVP
jgi:hypothetical protein